MNRLLLPVAGTLFLCAQSFNALAVEPTSSASGAAAVQTAREQIEAKRDQLSGVAGITAHIDKSSAPVLDAPVATDDAPTQEQTR